VTTDPLLYRFFADFPACFFHLVGRPPGDADHYRLDAIEYKATAVRLDGVFRPVEPTAGPAYLWEAQFQRADTVYANLMAKVGHFLQHDGPDQDWVAVVVYPTRSVEQKNLHPYRCLLDSDQLVRVFLDELPPPGPDQFEVGVLQLIASKPDAALERAQAMIPRVRASERPPEFQRLLLQFIETVIVFQFPNWSREEVEKMLQVTDARQTRLFQEGREEGREETRVEVTEEIARRLLEMGRPIEEIATATGLTVAKVRKLAKKKS
jgi:predicted transposase/invertase (TIGR01784 family)